MIHHYRTTGCPYCGKATTTHTIDNKVLYGSPFRECENCHHTYFDAQYHEKGLDEFASTGNGLSFSLFITTALFLFMFISGIQEDLIRDSHAASVIVTIISGAVSLFCISGIISSIEALLNPEEYHKKQISYIEGERGDIPAVLKESMDRLSKKEYLDKLKAHNVEVPDYFYQRIENIKPDKIIYTHQPIQNKYNSTPINTSDSIISSDDEYMDRNWYISAIHNALPVTDEEADYIFNNYMTVKEAFQTHGREGGTNAFIACIADIQDTYDYRWPSFAGFINGLLNIDGFVSKNEWNSILEISKKRALTRLMNSANNISTSKDTSSENEVLFCRFCGNQLPKDSVFCNRCGRKITM